MQPYVKRISDERNELSVKCDDLLLFIGGELFMSLTKEKKDLLNEQYAVMRDYLSILGRRLALEK